MDENKIQSGVSGAKPCKIVPLSDYPIKYPTYTNISFKNFLNKVDFQSDKKLPCKNTWYQDVKSTHIRNRRLLDLKFKAPKCCSDVYNIVGDRQKLKKLKSYGLTRSVRTLTSNLEPEEPEVCQPEERSGECAEEQGECHTRGICFPVLEMSDSDSEEEEEYKFCSSGSESECSGCSLLGGGTRRRRHKVVQKNWRDLLHVPGAELCRDSVVSEIKKHKLGYDMSLKLKKVF